MATFARQAVRGVGRRQPLRVCMHAQARSRVGAAGSSGRQAGAGSKPSLACAAVSILCEQWAEWGTLNDCCGCLGPFGPEKKEK